jgi:hypothetical protein
VTTAARPRRCRSPGRLGREPAGREPPCQSCVRQTPARSTSHGCTRPGRTPALPGRERTRVHTTAPGSPMQHQVEARHGTGFDRRLTRFTQQGSGWNAFERLPVSAQHLDLAGTRTPRRDRRRRLRDIGTTSRARGRSHTICRVSGEPVHNSRVMQDAESKEWVEPRRSGCPTHEQARARLDDIRYSSRGIELVGRATAASE